MHDSQIEEMTGAERAEYAELERKDRESRTSDGFRETQIVQVICGDKVVKMQVWKVNGNQIVLRGLKSE